MHIVHVRNPRGLPQGLPRLAPTNFPFGCNFHSLQALETCVEACFTACLKAFPILTMFFAMHKSTEALGKNMLSKRMQLGAAPCHVRT